MSLKRLVGAGALSLYAGMVGTNSMSAYQEYEQEREALFEYGLSTPNPFLDGPKNAQFEADHARKENYNLAVYAGFPTSAAAGLFAVYLLFGKRKEE